LRLSANISVGVSITNHHAESDADMPLLSCLSRTWSHIQGTLFPWLTEELGPLTETHKRVVTALEVAGVEAFVQVWPGLPGRPLCDRVGARLRGQGGDQAADHCDVDRPAYGG
jgi:hypothetical protein